MKSSSGSVSRQLVFILPLFFLAACSSLGGTKTSAITADDTRNGALVSNAVLAPLGNGILGNSVVQLAASDRRAAIDAEYKALEYAPKGETVSWKGRSGRSSGEVTAAQPYQVGSQNCRQYSHNFIIDGAPKVARGTACRNDDGSWTPLT